MSLGELKLPNFSFNPQLQLNNDLLVSNKSASSFDDVLKNKSVDNLEVDPKSKYKGFTNNTLDREPRYHFNNDRKQFDNSRDIGELKESIREGIAQKKLQKEMGNVGADQQLESKVIQLQKLQEKIESLEKAIKEELGLNEETPMMEMIASMLGIEVEELIQQLTATETPVEGEEVLVENLVENIVEMVTSENVDVEELVKELTEMVEKMPLEKLEAFDQIITQVIEQVEEPEIKEALMPLEQKVEEAVEIILETAPVELTVEAVKTEIHKAQAERVDLQTNNTQVQNKDVTEVVVEAKEETPKQETQTKQEPKPMMSLEVKTTKVESAVNFEDQVNLMKNESSTLITSAKIQPKGVVARSIMNQVVQGTKMSLNLSDQGSEILIKLNPKNLGNVALKMSFDKGVLLAEIQVENQTVKSIVESNLDDLRSALKQEGYSIGDLDVSVNKENTGQNEQQSSQQFKGKIKHESFEEIEERLNQQNLVNEKEINYLA